MIVGRLYLLIVEEMLLAKIKPHLFVPPLVSDAMLAAHRAKEIGAVFKRDSGTGGKHHDPGFFLPAKIPRAFICG